jgi:cellulose synthase operon protein C
LKNKTLLGLSAKSFFTTLLVLLIAACGQLGLSEDELHQRALQQQASGDFRAALIDFKNVLQRNPSHADARLGLGLVSLEMGDLGTARVELQRARELGLEPERLSIPFGRLWLAEGEYQRLLKDLTLSETESGEAEHRAQILQLRGEAMLALGRAVQAMAYFEGAIGIDPSAPLPHVGIAAIHMAEGREEAARASLQSALKIDRRTHQAWTLLGDIERSDTRLKQAAVAYGEAIEASPTPYPIYLKRGLTWLALNDMAAAEQDLDMMRRISAEHPATSYLAGLLHFEVGRYADAQSAFQAALSRAENFQPAVFFLGASFFAQEQWTQAEHHLGRFLAANPESVEAARLLAAVQAQDGDLEHAKQLVQNILSRNPDDPVALNLMGSIHLARGQRDTGIGYLQRLASVRTEDPASHTPLAAGLLQPEQSQASLEELETALRGLPEGFELEIAHVVSLIQRGEFRSALDAGDRLIERLPNNPIPHTLNAAAYLGLDRIREARESLLSALRVSPGDPTASINLAQLSQSAGDTDEAKGIYRESLAHNPGHVDISMRLAFLEAQSGNFGAMQGVLESSVETYPQALGPRLMLGRYYLLNSEPRRVLTLLEPVRQSSGENPELLRLLARAQIAAGLGPEAIATLRDLSAQMPKTADAHYLAGQYFDEAGDTREARQQYLKALDIQPDHAATLRSIATLELREGRANEALAFARRMQALTDTAAAGHAFEGHIRTLRAEYAEARRAQELAYELEPTANRVIVLGRAMQNAGQTGDAAIALQAHLARNPDEHDVRLQLAQTLFMLGKKAEATREYEELVRSQPQNAVALNNLAYLYYDENDLRALEIAERAFALTPENPAIAHTLGRILLDSGESERALNLLRQARSALSDNAEVRFSYAAALAKNERADEARQELSALLDEFGAFPQRAKAEELLGSLH